MSKKAAEKSAPKSASSKRASASPKSAKKSSGADPKLDTSPQGPPAHQAEVGSGPPPRLSAEDQRIEDIKKEAKARNAEKADPDELVELDDQPENIPDPIKGFMLTEDTGEPTDGEEQEKTPTYVTREAKDRAEEEVVSFDDIDSICNDMEEKRGELEDKQPELVTEFNAALRGLLNLRGAIQGRKNRILSEGKQAARAVLARKREEQAREEAEGDTKKG